MTSQHINSSAILSVTAAAAGLFALACAPAQADDAVILASCKAELKLSDSGCACVLDKVHSELSDTQVEFFVAAIGKNQPAMMQAQMALTGAEMMEIATFMTATPQSCQNQ